MVEWCSEKRDQFREMCLKEIKEIYPNMRIIYYGKVHDDFNEVKYFSLSGEDNDGKQYSFEFHLDNNNFSTCTDFKWSFLFDKSDLNDYGDLITGVYYFSNKLVSEIVLKEI